MQDYDYEKLKEVGNISWEALQYAKELVKPGASVLDACERIENFIRSRGMQLAFPVNISANERAAHYTATISDSSVFGERDILKVDVGARHEDVLGDCAMTIDLSGEHAKMVEAAGEALEAGLASVKAGAKLNDIGREMAKVAESRGFKPIRNLGGHGIEHGELHASIFIPNYDNGDTTPLEEGQVIALEPFLTTGEGFVIDSDIVQIFQLNGPVAARSPEARKLAEMVEKEHRTYPFAIRWLAKEFASEFSIRRGLNELSGLGVLESFPTLTERGRGMVAQAEKEAIVEKDSCTVVTK